MKQRVLGRGGLAVSALGLGCLGMSDYYGTPDDDESLATIHRAMELGVTLFDTADMYGAGRNEELLGRALTGRRDRAIVATKFGLIRGATGGFAGIDGSPNYVRRACEASLARLGVDWIDLYYYHRVDPRVPIEETVGAMADLVRSGYVRFIGLCEVGPQTIARAAAVHPVAAVQTEYSLWSREPAESVLRACRERGVGFVAYSPLGRGFLTGAVKRVDDLPDHDYRRGNPRFQKENFARNQQLVQSLQGIAAAKGCSVAQLVLAWLLNRGDDVVPLPGTKRRRYLEENLGALEVSLGVDDLAAIDLTLAEHGVAGSRYSEASQRLIEPGVP
ncbi:MAG TPA: aldo/keto reductase [Candidatus Dormibacteraeota bacterium]|nr:aldo/keto reductase [Candidatus Dormibacteraeota bacterium]